MTIFDGIQHAAKVSRSMSRLLGCQGFALELMCAFGSFPGAIRLVDPSAAPGSAMPAGEHRTSNICRKRPIRVPLNRGRDQASKVETVQRRTESCRG